GHCSGALWPDAQAAPGVDAHQPSATGADLGDIQGRDAQQMTTAFEEPAAAGDAGANLVLGHLERPSFLQDGSFCSGSAHVDGNNVLTELEGGNHAGRGTRSDHLNRTTPR